MRNLRRFGKKGSATPTGFFGQGTSEKAKLAVKRGEEHKARRGVKTKGMSEETLDEKCWKGYEKKGMKTMFGKRYNNCVKKEEFSDWRDDLQLERTNSPSTLGDMNSRFFSGDKNTYTTNNITQGGQGAGMALGAIGGAAALHYGAKAAKSIGKSVKNTKDKIKSKFKKEEYSDWRSEIDEGLTAGTIGTAAVLGAVGGTASAIGNMSAKNVAKKLNKEKKEEVGYEGKDDSKKLHEDDMKGMSVKSGHKRPTKSGAGMTQKLSLIHI